ncbi:hypothetical protein [Amorphus orientalis]|uniref:Uncharacterized protein n=1 Tax=Amorphus orientalis TaxID=649198 RepID=A0AAE3VM69_9HYPH|nr:hypothetical protein [Amorphus orientalis]MDQ0314618.1 hypothetical protein [Amorphus orientalis]
MSDTPNNFPSEGAHSTITRGALETLEAERATPQPALDYTIGGALETEVHSAGEAQREYAIRSGYDRFEEVSEALQRDYGDAHRDGYGAAQFNASAPPQKSYAEQQREAAANAQERGPEIER